MRPADNGRATCVRVQVGVRLQLWHNNLASIAFNLSWKCCFQLITVDSSHFFHLLVSVLPPAHLLNHFGLILFRRMISENRAFGFHVFWFDALYFLRVLGEIMIVWELLRCAGHLVRLELLKFETPWLVDVVVASSAFWLKSRGSDRSYFCIFVVLVVKKLIGCHNNNL